MSDNMKEAREIAERLQASTNLRRQQFEINAKQAVDIVVKLQIEGFEDGVIENTLIEMGFDAGVVSFALTKEMEKEPGSPYNVPNSTKLEM